MPKLDSLVGLDTSKGEAVAEDQWMDDDLVLSPSSPVSPGKQTAADLTSKSPRRRLSFDKFTTDVFSAVPGSSLEISALIDQSATALWQQRRYGEPIERTEMTSQMSASRKSEHSERRDLELSLNRDSDRQYRQLLFGFSKEIATEVFGDLIAQSGNETSFPWQKGLRLWVNRLAKKVPRSADDLAEIVRRELFCNLDIKHDELVEKCRQGMPLGREKLVSRKRLDRVDEILLAEMYEEEPDWCDFEREEAEVKLEVADDLSKKMLDDALDDIIPFVSKSC